MQKYMTKQQFINFKQWQWCYTFWVAITSIFFVDMKTALACTLIGAYSLLRCVKWHLFD
ncbi:hypothetical protein ACNNLS_07260 [Aerococcus viridans]